MSCIFKCQCPRKFWRSVQNVCPTLSPSQALQHQGSLVIIVLLVVAGRRRGNVRDQVQPLSSVVRLTQTSLCLLATTSRCRQRESRVMAPLPLCLSLLSHCSSINKQRREEIAFMSKRQRLMLQVLESYNVDWPLPHSPNLDRLLICCKHDELKLS